MAVQESINDFFKRPLANIRDKRLFIMFGLPFIMLIGLMFAEALSSIIFGGSIGMLSVGSDVMGFLFSPGLYDTSSNDAGKAITNDIKSSLNLLKMAFWTLLSSTILYLLFKKPKNMN